MSPERRVLHSGAMTLRTRLVLALIAAAVLPMAVLVGVPLVRATARADEEGHVRVELARRQAAFLVARRTSAFGERLARAAVDLAEDEHGRQALYVGPEERAHATARTIAERNGLPWLEILKSDGTLLATSREAMGAGLPSALGGLVGLAGPAGLANQEAAPGASPYAARIDPALPEAAADGVVSSVESGLRAALCGRRTVASLEGPLVVVAVQDFAEDLLRDVAEITGETATLVDAEGRVVAEAPVDVASLTDRLFGSVPVGSGGFRIEVAARRPDVARLRRDLLATFAGIAPFALLAALAVGGFVAHRVTRPVRDLAERADRISSREAPFSSLEKARDEVQRLTRSFDRMLESLDRSETRRVAAERVAAWQEVARRVAHEVRNALSPIRLAAENLRRTQEKAPSQLPAAVAAETGAILEEVDSLRRLVDEFSQFARLAPPQPRECSPREIVEQAVALFRARLESLGVNVTVDTANAPPTIHADADQLGRVLKNAIANALDALEPVRGPRALHANARGEGAYCVFEIADTGVGLDAEARRRVFEPYFTTRSERGGTGLGMAIAYRIVAEHGGTIEAHGAVGEGATITVRVPREVRPMTLPAGSGTLSATENA